MKSSFRSALPLLVLVPLVACQKSSPTRVEIDFAHNPGGEGTPVARFEGDSITAEELKERFAQLAPSTRAHYQTVEQKKEYVKSLARAQVLANEAIRRGLHHDPDVLENAKKLMISKLIAQELKARSTPPTEEELRAYYDKHQSDYVRPEKVRLAHVFLAAGKDAPNRAAVRSEAEKLLVAARESQDFQHFAQLVRERSDDARTKAIDGDLRYRSAEELTSELGAEVAEAAATLTKTGEVFGEVVATERGFHILKLHGRQPALNITFAQVKEQLEGRLMNERRMKEHDAFVTALLEKAQFTVDEDALKNVPIDLTAPTARPTGPRPGFVTPAGAR